MAPRRRTRALVPTATIEAVDIGEMLRFGRLEKRLTFAAEEIELTLTVRLELEDKEVGKRIARWFDSILAASERGQEPEPTSPVLPQDSKEER